MHDLLAALGAPFPADAIEARPGATQPPPTDADALGRAQALLYADPRHYYFRLNDVVGLDWSDSYSLFPSRGKLVVICELTISGQKRTGDGECAEDDPNALTVASAQAFKRAAAKFGLGAYLYSSPNIWAEAKFGPKEGTKKRPCFGFTKQGMYEVQQAVDDWYVSEGFVPPLTSDDLRMVDALRLNLRAATSDRDLFEIAEDIGKESEAVRAALRADYTEARARISSMAGSEPVAAGAAKPAPKKKEAGT